MPLVYSPEVFHADFELPTHNDAVGMLFFVVGSFMQQEFNARRHSTTENDG